MVGGLQRTAYQREGACNEENDLEARDCCAARRCLGGSLRSVGRNDLESVAYETLDNGETYGSVLSEDYLGYLPDWISAVATNDVNGYIKQDDFWVPEAQNPADAVENFSVQRVRSIPVYEAPGSDVVVGMYDMYYGG